MTLKPPELPEHVEALHREVQRKFGRNVLLLQQCEMLLKHLLARHDLTGPRDELRAIWTRKVGAVARKTLGSVSKGLTEQLIRPLPTSTNDPPGDPSHFSFRLKIEFSPADFKAIQEGLERLVRLRNELVHHFLDQHDIWTEAGCRTAERHLDDGFSEIDRHVTMWQEVTETANELLAESLAQVKGRQHDDSTTGGLVPGESGFTWSSSVIVRSLRDAESVLADGGWTSLRNAVDYVRQRQPDHVPHRYACSTWRQVVHESKQFEIRKVQAAPGNPTEIWYRSKATGKSVKEAR